MPRLFVALVPPAPVRSELAALATPLPGVRWTPVDNLHLTLRFIGETAGARADDFAASLERVHVEPFLLPIAGLGIFPPRGPAKVLWAGVGAGHTRLYQLRKQVDEALLAVDSGVPMPGFHPHFTLGRIDAHAEAKPLARFIERHAAFEAPPFRVTEILLLASELTPGHPPAYRVMRSFPLSA